MVIYLTLYIDFNTIYPCFFDWHVNCNKCFENENNNQKSGDIKWQDIQEVIQAEEVMDVAVVQVTEDITAGQVTAGGVQGTEEEVVVAQEQKTVMPSTIVEMDGNSHIDALQRKKWEAEYVLDTKSTILTVLNGITAQVI